MKKIFTLVFSAYVGLASSQNPANGLQACYPMDNNAQNYASTGSPLNGTLINVTSTTGHTGSSNTAYSLNGTVGSYIELPDNPGLKSDSVFFSGWFRIDSLPSPQYLSGLQYLVYTSNGCISNFEAYSLDTYYEPSVAHHLFRITKSGTNCGYNKPQISSVTPAVVGNWYHVCFYITNSVMKIYVNGVLESSMNHNVQFGYQPGSNVYLGVTNQSNFNRPFKGAVDNVRFYNRELTSQEIMQLYTQDPSCSSISQPVSSFSTSAKEICSGASITFTDQSTNTPTAWNWQFPGGNPASSTQNNPTIFFPLSGVYTVSLVASNAAGAGNTSVQTITVTDCVSISENNTLTSQVNIHPNPAVDRVYVEGLGENTLVVCDLLGKQVHYAKTQVAENSSEIHLQGATPGIYFVKIISPQGNCLNTIKLIWTK
jgi:PKD repeat protein